VTSREREILRRLAGRVAEIASHPEQESRRELWYKHNALEGQKVMILAFPEGGWRELLPDSQLETEDPLARQWEWHFKATVYHREHIKDDRVTEAVFNIPYVHSFSNWGLETRTIRTDSLGAYRWEPPLKELDNIKKLKFREIEVDVEETRRRVGLAQEIFGDLLKVRIRGTFWWSLGMMTTAIMLRGLERLMMDIYDNPGWLHELMSFLRDGTLAELEYLEKKGFLTLNNEGDYVGSGGFGYSKELPAADFDGRKVRPRDMWGFCEAQEFVSVSPEKFEEFCLNYQMPILERFGLNCYGCCEPLHTRFHLLKKIPNLRRVSVSPWCDLKIAAEALQDRFIFSYKPNPAHLAAETFNENLVRKTLKEALEIARGCHIEIIMKDTHTFRNQPERVERWVRIAKEVAFDF